MKKQRCLEFVALAITVVPSLSPCRAEANDLENQLKTRYEGKVLTLRQFYEGKKLQFDVNGRLTSREPIGPWTIDGQIAVKEVHLNGPILQLRGDRQRLVFGAWSEPPRDVIEMAARHELTKEFRKVDDKTWRKFAKDAEVEVDLDLASVPKDETEVARAVNAVFLSPSDEMVDLVPECWKAFLLRQQGKAAPEKGPGSQPFVKAGLGVSAPRALHAPDPEYAEVARQLGYQPTASLRLVVTPEGSARDVEITKAVGLGLDEKAVEAVSRWRFEPARKDGTPVPVQANVEVTFRLY